PRQGAGRSTPAATRAVGPAPAALAVGDFDRDGIPDLAVTHDTPAHTGPGAVTILLGNGDGTFRNAGDNPVGTGPGSAAIADFDNDGNPDVVTANLSDGTVSVLLGNDDGYAVGAESLPAARVPESVADGTQPE